MTYEENTENTVGTLIGKSRAIRDLLGKSIALTHDIIGVPLHSKSTDKPTSVPSLEILSDELRMIQERAKILFAQLERITWLKSFMAVSDALNNFEE